MAGVVAALVAGVAVVAAVQRDPIEAYLADIRSAAVTYGEEQPTDLQALMVGSMVCGMGDTLGADTTGNPEVLAVIREHCAVFPLTDEQWAAYGAPIGDTAPVAPTADAGPALSERGAIPKRVGEQGGIHSESDGPDTLTFTVTDIEVDPTCQATDVYQEDAVPVPGGHFVAMTVDIRTGPDYQPSGTALQAADYVGTDGYTVNPSANSWASFLCAGDTALSSSMQPGNRYRGVIMLNVPSVPGTVVLSGPGGERWEYEVSAA